MDLFGFHEDLATTSAFVQQRAKIRPEAFEKLFDLFVKNTSERSTYRGLQLLAVDGSDFLTASNPDDPDSFFPGTVEQQKDRKYAYKVNFSAAVQICRQFFLRDLPPPRVEALLAKHISPIRPGRSRPRKLKTKQPFGFLYRVA